MNQERKTWLVEGARVPEGFKEGAKVGDTLKYSPGHVRVIGSVPNEFSDSYCIVRRNMAKEPETFLERIISCLNGNYFNGTYLGVVEGQRESDLKLLDEAGL